MERLRNIKIPCFSAVIAVWQFRCWKVTIVKDEVAKGLVELISHHGITKLVMGAAPDERYSEYGSQLFCHIYIYNVQVKTIETLSH